ncbi:MAG: hypothetical protein LBL74_03350 [Bacteroidales bacterium]|jgi:hypothetical protein|nr:hypothetical protein [Bacteroidales bacterium]
MGLCYGLMKWVFVLKLWANWTMEFASVNFFVSFEVILRRKILCFNKKVVSLQALKMAFCRLLGSKQSRNKFNV